MAARTLHKLSARRVASERNKGRYADGGGLYLQVQGPSTKSWAFRYTLNGKSRQMGLGSVNALSLSEARERASGCRKLLLDGIDPIDTKNQNKLQQLIQARTSETFKECAETYIGDHQASWKSDKHARQWIRSIETYVYPEFGSFPVQSIDIQLVMKVLHPIWQTKNETASRVRGRIEAILDWATVMKYREGDNPARWKGNLDNLLPARTKIGKVKHYAALPYEEIGSFMEVLIRREGISAQGLEFLILTAARTGEVIGATWDEINLDKAVWTIPADRMKADREHRVPLSDRAINVLVKMQVVAVSNYIFPSGQSNKPLSNMAFLQQLKRMNRNDLTVHGFRSTFRDWAAERTAYPGEMAEMALAHSVGNKVEAAYRRGDMFEKRRNMMNAWAEFCSRNT
ncbi:MAG: tyrosine-type recombinase/integrase [Rhodospirillales bacterium]|nr:tyrosine-type recombinase/integrase [Rhodospirillales bacterium]